jgi:dipeptidyl aminopeptidase/acylaminoacyl peptidase
MKQEARMPKRIMAVLLAATLAAQAQKRPVTHEDVFLMKRTGPPALSPDGRWVVFSLTEPDYDPAKQTADLWLVPASGSAAPRRLTATRGPESGVAFAPDSSAIAFTSRRDGDSVAQVYVLPLTGGEAWRLTNRTEAASAPKWSPDGKRIMFQSDFDPVDRKAKKHTARVYDTFPFRYWNEWLDEKRPRLYVQAVDAAAKAVEIGPGPEFGGQFNPTAGGQTLNAEWSPDGQWIVFAATVNRHEAMYKPVETHLWRIRPAGGAAERVTSTPGVSYGSPAFSPDGKRLYARMRKEATAAQPYALTRLAAIAWPGGGEPRVLTADWDRSVDDFAESAGAIYLTAEDAGYDRVFRLPAAGGAPQAVLTGGYSNLECEAGVCVAARGGSTQPNEIARLDLAAGAFTPLTWFNREKLAALDLPEPIHFWFTAKNGKRIHSLLVPPPALDKGKKYPIVVFPHGGPNTMSKDVFSTRWNYHLLTAPGYALLMTNYTGSTGFGEKFAGDIERDVLRGPAGEILEAIGAAAEEYPWLDTARQAAIGASYGGYLMNWFNGHTDQFKCLVNHAGAVNNESQYGTNDGGIERELRMGGPIWEKKGQWNGQSPVRYSMNWKTPMLITQGELDFRVPLSESMTTYKILQRRKIPARLIVFPDEGHWILKGENSRFHMQEVLSWLKKHL